MSEYNSGNFTYFVDFFLETLFKHLVSLIEHDTLKRAKVNISTFNVIKDTSASAHEEINTVSQCACLIFDVDATVHGQGLEFIWMVLELG